MVALGKDTVIGRPRSVRAGSVALVREYLVEEST